MKRKSLIVIVALVAALLPMQSASAAKKYVRSVSLTVKQTPSVDQRLLSLYGKVSPARAGVTISVQVHNGARWRDSAVSTKTAKTGTWIIREPITTPSTSVKYRVVASYRGSTVTSAARNITIKSVAENITLAGPFVESLGPGGRIWGMDISRWDHPGDAPIDFTKMFSRGVRFVIIKSSDTDDAADARALRWMPEDRIAAQAAGIYTGFYHYAKLPNSDNPDVIKADALAQADKAVWRLASVGGYNDRDLPYALDLEDNCVAENSKGTCIKRATKSQATLWALTWLENVQQRTGRAPILYSYPVFLESNVNRDPRFRNFPLWLAHYGVSPHDAVAFPGQRTAGCYVSPWTQSDCSSTWSIWQYTSCGKATDFGINRSNADLNVFRGTSDEFLALIAGTWTPQPGDFLPANDPTTVKATLVSSTTTDDPVTISLDVLGSNGKYVFTGRPGVEFVVGPNDAAIAPILATTRSTVGTWQLKITGIPAGTWNALITYQDPTGVYAPSSQPLMFTLAAGVKPIATPTPKPSQTPKPLDTPKPTSTVSASPAPIVYKPSASCGG